MGNRRRDDGEMVTIEDRAAKIFAAAYGYGDPMPLAGLKEQTHREWDSGGGALEPKNGSIRVAKRGNAAQQAGRAISQNQRQQPKWFRALPAEKKADAMRWSDAHPLQTKRGEIGQQREWYRVFARMVTPRGPKFDNVIVAIVDAERAVHGEEPLSRIELAMLRAFALQEWASIKRVISCATAAGHRRDIAQNAMVYRILYPNSRHLHHGFADRAREVGMRKSQYTVLEQAATDLLRMWLHDACVKFMDALTRQITKEDYPEHPATSRTPRHPPEQLYK